MHEAHAIQARDRTGTRGHRCMARVSRRKPQFAKRSNSSLTSSRGPRDLSCSMRLIYAIDVV